MKCFIFCVFLLGGMSVNAQQQFPKKIVQFGWDHPSVSFVKKNIRKMEKTPFDGVAFSFDFGIFNVFDTTVYRDSKFQFDDLKKIGWKKFTDNFIIVHAQSLNGPNWLNDRAWNNIIANVENVSKALGKSGAKGLFFDPEYYYHHVPDKNPWIYKASLYPNLTYEEVGGFVRKRGEQFIRALQRYKTDLEILSFWLLSLVTLQSKQAPVEQAGMALFPFFVEGMMAGKNESTVITDGNELAYSYKSEYQFLFSGDEVRGWGQAFMPDSLKPIYNRIQISQPIYYDLIYATFPQFQKKYSIEQKDNWFTSNLYLAFKTSDKYVWFYNEKLDWWVNGNPRLAKLISGVRKNLSNEFKKANSQIISGASQEMNFETGRRNFKSAFRYTYDRSKGLLNVVLDAGIIEFYVIQDSRVLKKVSNPSRNISLELKGVSARSNLMLAARKGGLYVAFLN